MKPYKTSDLGLAAYLATQGYDLLGCVPANDTGRLLFVFEDKDTRDDLVEAYITGQGMVSAKLYSAKITAMKKALKDPVV